MTTPPTYEQLVAEVDGLKRQVKFLLEQHQLQTKQNQLFQDRIGSLEADNMIAHGMTTEAFQDYDYLERKFTRVRECLEEANTRLRDNNLEPVSVVGL